MDDTVDIVTACSAISSAEFAEISYSAGFHL